MTKITKKTTASASCEEREPDFISASHQLTKMLFSKELESGLQLKESLLAKEFNVTRPAMREALSQAIGWRLVEYVPYCGYRIRVFTLGDLRDWVETREGIEPIAARRVAKRGLTDAERSELKNLIDRITIPIAQRSDPNDLLRDDMAFHYAIVRMSGNCRFNEPGLAGFYNSVLSHHHRYLWTLLSYTNTPERSDYPDVDAYFAATESETNRSHRLILQALETQDDIAAEAHVRLHCFSQTKNIYDAIKLFGDESIPLDELENTEAMQWLISQSSQAAARANTGKEKHV